MKPPAFQFYADDFLAGTILMTLEERGVYITLLCMQWNRGFVTESDFDRLGNGMANASLEHVKGKFEDDGSGCWRNARMERVRLEQQENREARRNAGILGAAARWQTHGNAIAEPLAKNGSPSPSPSPTPLQRSDKASDQALQRSGEVKNKALNPAQKVVAERLEACLNGQWVNDAGKWILRIRGCLGKTERVVAEVENAIKESRVKTTPAQYAEQIWKEFK